MQQVAAADVVAQLRKRFGVRGTTNLELDETIIPVVNVADLDSAPWNVKRGGTGSQSAAAVAAQFGYVGLTYPTGIGLPLGSVLVTRFIHLWASAAMQVRIASRVKGEHATLAAITAVGGMPSWETQHDALVAADVIKSPAQMGFATSGTSFLNPLDGMEVSVPVTGVYLPLSFVLRPGGILVAQGLTVNVALGMSVFFDEYLPE